MGSRRTTYPSHHLIFYAFSFFLILCLLGAIWIENIFPLVIPVALVVAYAGLVNLNKLYALFFILLPFSIEAELVGGLGTDLPAEPFMLTLSLIALYLFANNYNKIDASYLRHPITVILLIHIIWIGFTAFFSQYPLVSIKYLLAKIWYVIPFYFLATYLLQKERNFRFLVLGIIGSLSLAISFVLFSHAQDGFAFDRVNQAVSPIFRNHVNYACLITLLMPYVWYLFVSSKNNFSKYLHALVIIFFLIAIYLSYTRAAYVALAIAFGAYFIIKLRLTKYVLLIASILVISAISFLSIDNNYLDYKPEFERAITHKKFDNLIEATTKLEDISTVERFYRWIAGTHMVADKPIMGFGPATFYFFYQSYTVTGFQTYVSDNPEKSGIHNYYLMTAVEQGFVGCLIFISFCFIVILKGEETFHKLTGHNSKSLIMAAILSFIIICAILIINDMVEAAKVGPFFFLAPALVLIYDLKTRQTE